MKKENIIKKIEGSNLSEEEKKEIIQPLNYIIKIKFKKPYFV